MGIDACRKQSCIPMRATCLVQNWVLVPAGSNHVRLCVIPTCANFFDIENIVQKNEDPLCKRCISKAQDLHSYPGSHHVSSLSNLESTQSLAREEATEFGGMASPRSAAISARPKWVPAALWQLLIKLTPGSVQKLAKSTSDRSLFRKSALPNSR